MMDKRYLDEKVVLTHLGDDYGKYMGAVVPPVFFTSLHVFPTMEEYVDFDWGKEDAFVYGRTGNPTVHIVEQKIAALEHGERALVFSSGMGAAAAAILAACRAGSHIICINNSYGPVKKFLNTYCIPKLDMNVTYVKGTDIREFEEAIREETDLIILESPSTFVFSLVDLKAVAELAHRYGAKTYIDNTFCTPLYQKPLDMGIDFSMHTLSKYLGGHSDLIGGVLVSKDKAMMDYIASGIRELTGAILGPMEAWLVMRGMRTLPVRLKQHEETAVAVAEYLEQHPRVKRVYYPGLKSHPQYGLMEQQQTGNSGLLSFELKASPEETLRFCNALKLFKIGCSWGGFESLAVMPVYRAEEEELAFLGVGRGLVRIHCGLEGTRNLIQDLEQAFKAV